MFKKTILTTWSHNLVKIKQSIITFCYITWLVMESLFEPFDGIVRESDLPLATVKQRFLDPQTQPVENVLDFEGKLPNLYHLLSRLAFLEYFPAEYIKQIWCYIKYKSHDLLTSRTLNFQVQVLYFYLRNILLKHPINITFRLDKLKHPINITFWLDKLKHPINITLWLNKLKHLINITFWLDKLKHPINITFWLDNFGVLLLQSLKKKQSTIWEGDFS